MLTLPMEYSNTKHSFRRPIVNWKHPLARDLIGCWLPGIGSGVNLAGNYDLTEGSGTTKYIGFDGPAVGSVATGSTAGLWGGSCPASFKTWTGFSVYIHYTSVSIAGSNARAVSVEYDANSGSPFMVAGIYVGAVPTMGWNTNGTFTSQAFSTATWPSATIKDQRLGATFLVGGNATAYKNGNADGSKAFGAIAPTTSATSYLTLGRQATNTNINGYCSLAYVWNRELSAYEMAWLELEPYSFLLPTERELPVIYSGPSFLPSWATQSNIPVIGAGTY